MPLSIHRGLFHHLLNPAFSRATLLSHDYLTVFLGFENKILDYILEFDKYSNACQCLSKCKFHGQMFELFRTHKFILTKFKIFDNLGLMSYYFSWNDFFRLRV